MENLKTEAYAVWLEFEEENAAKLRGIIDELAIRLKHPALRPISHYRVCQIPFGTISLSPSSGAAWLSWQASLVPSPFASAALAD
jgi:hypothetical protein